MLQHYLAAAYGGVLLGFFATVKLAYTGAVLGISGSLKQVVNYQSLRSFMFVSGMVAGAFAAKIEAPNNFGPYHGLSYGMLALCGVLAGCGTYYANGCTSGHGITGVARFSNRSITSTAIFFSVAVCVATFFNSATLLHHYDYEPVGFESIATVAVSFGTIFGIIALLRKKAPQLMTETIAVNLVEFFSGAGFAIGLVFSGMSQPINTLKFLDLRFEGWSPALSFVLVGALLVKGIVYHFHTIDRKKSIVGGDMQLVCTNLPVDSKLVFGSILFGIGWGYSGICPGPAIILLAQDDPWTGIVCVSSLLFTYGAIHRMESRMKTKENTKKEE